MTFGTSYLELDLGLDLSCECWRGSLRDICQMAWSVGIARMRSGRSFCMIIHLNRIVYSGGLCGTETLRGSRGFAGGATLSFSTNTTLSRTTNQ
jgi:hypothetical protein